MSARAAQKVGRSVTSSTMWPIPKKQIAAGLLPAMRVTAGLRMQSSFWQSGSTLPRPDDSIVISHSADVSSYKKRNYYMVDHAEYIIGVFDNQKKLRSGTAQTVNYALHQGKVITLIHPDTMEITAPAP